MWWGAVVAFCIGGAFYLLNRSDTGQPAPAPVQQADAAAPPLSHPVGPDAASVSGIEHLSGQAPVAVNPLDSVKPPQFRANDKGQLVVDEAFRVDLERVYGLHQGPDVLKKLEEFSAHLPDRAKQELRSQYQRYVQYDAAVMQHMAAQVAQEDMSLALAERELALLHELRQTYFGQESAQAMFGQEEAHSRELHDYIRHHTDPSLPLMQRVELAQAAWLKAREASQVSPASAP